MNTRVHHFYHQVCLAKSMKWKHIYNDIRIYFCIYLYFDRPEILKKCPFGIIFFKRDFWAKALSIFSFRKDWLNFDCKFFFCIIKFSHWHWMLMCRQKLEKNSNNLIRVRKFGVLLKLTNFLLTKQKPTLWAKLLKNSSKNWVLEPLRT